MTRATFEALASGFIASAVLAVMVLALCISFLVGFAIGKFIIVPLLDETLLPILAGVPWW